MLDVCCTAPVGHCDNGGSGMLSSSFLTSLSWTSISDGLALVSRVGGDERLVVIGLVVFGLWDELLLDHTTGQRESDRTIWGDGMLRKS
jgi:hypothetical protein